MSRSSIRDGLTLLRERDFPFLFGAHLVSWFGTSMAPIAIAFGVLQLTGSARATGWVIASQTVSQIAALLIGGVVADRLRRQYVMIAADLLAMMSQGVMAFAFAADFATVPLLMVLMAINGVALAFHGPAMTGFVPQVVAIARLQSANALLGTARSGAFALGAACAGILVATAGPGATLAVNAVTFGLSAALVSRLHPTPRHAVVRATMRADLSQGFREFTAHRWLWVIVLQFALVVAASHSVYALIGPAVANASMGGSKAWGFVTAAFGIGTLCGGFVALRLRVERPMRAATLCVFVFSAPSILLAVSATPWIVAMGTFSHGLAGQMFGVLWNTTLHRNIPAHVLSRVSAYDNFGSIALAPLGLIMAGSLLETIGARPTLMIAAGLIILPTLAVLTDRGVRELRLADAPTT